MGCNVSRLDGNAGPTYPARLRPLFLQRLDDFKARRHGHPLKAADSTPSKKQLLSHDIEDINNASHHSNNCSNNPSKIIVAYSLVKKPEQKITREVIKEEAVDEKDTEIPNRNCKNDREEEIVKSKVKNDVIEKSGEKINIDDDDFMSADEDIKEGEEEEDDGNDERMIGYEDDDAFPGSPSFRVYFEDQREGCRNDIGKKDAFKEAVSSDDNSVPSSKESSTTTTSSSLEKKVKRERKKRSFRGVVLPKNILNVKSCYTSCAHPSHRQKQPSESS